MCCRHTSIPSIIFWISASTESKCPRKPRLSEQKIRRQSCLTNKPWIYTHTTPTRRPGMQWWCVFQTNVCIKRFFGKATKHVSMSWPKKSLQHTSLRRCALTSSKTEVISPYKSGAITQLPVYFLPFKKGPEKTPTIGSEATNQSHKAFMASWVEKIDENNGQTKPLN